MCEMDRRSVRDYFPVSRVRERTRYPSRHRSSVRYLFSAMSMRLRTVLSTCVSLALAVPVAAQTMTQDSARRVDVVQPTPESRAGPRRWDCRVSDKEVQVAASAAYREFVGGDSSMSKLARAYGMPAKRDAFLRDFRMLDDARECRRVAEAIDGQFGLVDEQLRVFRIGSVYFLPGFGDGGMVVGLNGKILAVFIVPS